MKATLDRLTDRYIFLLNPLAHRNACQVALPCLFRNIGEVVVKDDLTPVNTTREDEVRIQDSLVTIDHKIRIDPEITSAITLAHSSGERFGPRCYYRARLQAESLARFDRVLAVIQNAVESMMKERDVVSAIQVIIDKNFPVAFERVMAPLHPAEVLQMQHLQVCDQIDAEIAWERRAVPIELNKYPVLPDLSLNRQQTICGSIEIANPCEIRCSTKFSLKRVGPTMIGTAQALCLSFRFSLDGGCVVAADVEKATQNPIVTSDYQERFSGQFPGQKPSRFANLID